MRNYHKPGKVEPRNVQLDSCLISVVEVRDCEESFQNLSFSVSEEYSRIADHFIVSDSQITFGEDWLAVFDLVVVDRSWEWFYTEYAE